MNIAEAVSEHEVMNKFLRTPSTLRICTIGARKEHVVHEYLYISEAILCQSIFSPILFLDYSDWDGNNKERNNCAVWT